MTNVEIVTREQLNERREQLLRRARMTWDDLRQGAEEYNFLTSNATPTRRSAASTLPAARGDTGQLSGVGDTGSRQSRVTRPQR
jgi:hypothetical protein